MRDIKEYIVEAAKSDIVMSTSVFAKFMSYNKYDDDKLMELLDTWYKEYAHVMVTKCKSGAYQTSFDIRVIFSKKDGGIIFKGVNKKTVTEFLLQLDSRFDSMEYNQDFGHLNVELTRDGLSEMFRNKDYWNLVEDFCNKHNL